MSWDDVEKVIHHACYNELRIASEEHPLVLALPPMTSRFVREKYCQMAFETFNVPALFLAHQAFLNIFASGRPSCTGLSVTSGNTATYITPVYLGHALDYLTVKVPLAGQQVTNALVAKLNASGYALTTRSDLAIAGHIKQQHCRVALDPTAPPPAEKEYEMPDESKITLSGEAQVGPPELLFQPQLYDETMNASDGLHYKIVEAVESCMPFMRPALYNHIVLSGGNTLLEGFPERLERELKLLRPQQQQPVIRVVAEPERRNLSWVGASILSSLSYFSHMCITKDEYDEVGPSMERKCF